MSSLSEYILSYQFAPIILVGGIAGTGMLPIASFLDAAAYQHGITSSDSATGDTNFGVFRVLPGGLLMNNMTATYPFANMTTAANAVITAPLKISLEMLVPANDRVSVDQKQAAMTALKSTLDNHTALGGWYNVSTPAYIYQGCILESLYDSSDTGEGDQPQVRWIWNFEVPLLTASALLAAQNPQMQTYSNQTIATGTPPAGSGTANINNPASNIVQNLVPAATNIIGANVAAIATSKIISTLASVSPILPGAIGLV